MINKDEVKKDIRTIIAELKDRGIETRPIWGLINEQVPYLNDEAYMIEKATYYADRVINLPSSTNITKEDIEYVVEMVKEVLHD